MPPKSRAQSRGAPPGSTASALGAQGGTEARRRMSGSSEQKRKFSDVTNSSQQQQQLQSAGPPPVDLYRVRSFTTRSGTVVNRGDSFKMRSGRSAAAAAAAGAGEQRNSSTPNLLGSGRRVSGRRSHGQRPDPERNDLEQSDPPPVQQSCSDIMKSWTQDGALSDERGGFGSDRVHPAETRRQRQSGGRAAAEVEETTSITAVETYCVQVVGSSGVGKTTMTQQLLTSEYLANKELNTGFTLLFI